MKSKQVLSIDQMKHLRELGLDTSDASMHWQFLPTVESFFNGVLALEERPTLFVSQPNMNMNTLLTPCMTFLTSCRVILHTMMKNINCKYFRLVYVIDT